MTRLEAFHIALAAEKIDGGCHCCCGSFCDDLNERNLGWSWTPEEVETNFIFHGKPYKGTELKVWIDWKEPDDG